MLRSVENLAFAVVALVILGYGLVSRRLTTTMITPPMVFVATGILLCSRVTGWIEIDMQSAVLHGLAEITLLLVLFTDASRIDLRLLRREHDMPVRMLGVGLPLTMVAGAAVAFALIPGLSLWEAVVLAVILAPTDAALGQAVVSSPQVPVRIRQALNVESGLNDGMALPILLFCLSLAGMTEHSGPASHWLGFAAKQLVLGPLAGVAVGWVGGRAIVWSHRRGWIDPSYQQLAAIGLALLSFALAEAIGGNGFIAAFCAGLVMGNSARSICGPLHEFAEAEGQLLTLLTFMLFGAAMVVPSLEVIGWQGVVYGALSLSLIRLVPVAIRLIGLDLRPSTVLFLGWFGPRGLASILYALLMVEEAELAGGDKIFAITMVTVLISVVAHGVTAVPASRRYASSVEAMENETPERQNVAEMPLRQRPGIVPFT